MNENLYGKPLSLYQKGNYPRTILSVEGLQGKHATNLLRVNQADNVLYIVVVDYVPRSIMTVLVDHIFSIFR
jgi:hypothetical protein